MSTKSVQIRGAVGNLSALILSPELKKDEKCPIVIMMHGLMRDKDADLLRSIAEMLKSKGIASLRFDFDGCGQSEGDFQNMTIPKEIEDARKVYEYVYNLDEYCHIAFLGHSQGGVVAGMAAGELTAEKVSCMVLMAPAAGVKDLAIKGNMMGALFDPLNIPDYIIANDRKIGREYIQTAQSLPIYETTALYTGPVLIIQGRADEVVNEIYAEKYHQVLTNSELKLMDNENHMFTYDTVKDTELVIDFFVKKFEETKPVDSEE